MDGCRLHHPGKHLDRGQQLRHLKVLGFDANKEVSVIDLAGNVSTVIDSVDLDGDAKLRSKVLSGLVRNPDFLMASSTK